MAHERRKGTGGGPIRTSDELIDVKTAAAIGSVSVATLRRLKDRGFPAPVDLPIHSFRYRRSEVEQFFGLRPKPEAGS